MAEKIVPKKGGAEPSQLELDVANGILNFQVSESKLTMHACLFAAQVILSCRCFLVVVWYMLMAAVVVVVVVQYDA